MLKSWLALSLIIIGFSVNAQEEKVLHNPPVPGFEVYDLCWGSYTTFKNLSAAATTYTWTIYDKDSIGAYTIKILTSSGTDIGYKFTHKGNYRVDLIADNGHTVALTQTITVDSITKADFNYQTCQARFLNLSRCSNTYTWNYGDSTNQGSTAHSPVYFYANYNYYHPSVVAKNGNITDSLKKTVWGVPNYLTGKFTYRLSNDTAYFFAADSAAFSAFLDYYWTWGDTKKELIIGPTGRKVWHYYPKKETDEVYYVYLLVRDVCNQNYATASFSIAGTYPVKGTSIFPNPPELGLVHLETEKKAEINEVKIVNAFGIVMQQYFIRDTPKGIDLDFSMLPKGIYSLIINFSGGDVINKKVVTGD